MGNVIDLRSGETLKSATFKKITGKNKASTEKKLKALRLDLKRITKSLDLDGKKGRGLSESTMVGVQRAILKQLIDLVPIAVKQYRSGGAEHKAYALSTIVNNIRELMADLHADEDLEAKADYIIDSIIEPQMKLIAQNLVNEVFLVRKTLLESFGTRDRNGLIQKNTKRLLKNQGKFIDEVVKSLREKVHNHVVDNG